jgi:hypothetical protein
VQARPLGLGQDFGSRLGDGIDHAGDILLVVSPAAEYSLPRRGGTGCFAMASLQRRHRAQPGDDVGDIG